MRKIALLLFLSSLASGLFSQDVYVLCEGAYNTPGASVWVYNDEESSNNAEKWYWYYDAGKPSGGNPLGDTGQSLVIDGDQMFVVCNNSHNIEVVDFSEGHPVFNRSILLEGSSPRDILIDGSKAYVASWGVSGILVLDLSTDTVMDTIVLSAAPEDLLMLDGCLYASLIQDASWAKYDGVAVIDPVDHSVIKEYKVVSGANQMAVYDGYIYVTGTWFDANYNAFTGTSRISTDDGSVLTVEHGATPNFAADISAAGDGVYRVFGNSICCLNSDLSFDEDRTISDVASAGECVYGMRWFDEIWYVGLTDDYTGPDPVRMFNASGDITGEFQVSGMPGDFAFYSKQTALEPSADLPESFQVTAGPNPFNGTVKLSVDFPGTKALTEAAIYSLNGHLIHTFPVRNISEHAEYIWNSGTNSSGLYLAVFRTNREVRSVKISLLK